MPELRLREGIAGSVLRAVGYVAWTSVGDMSSMQPSTKWCAGAIVSRGWQE